MMLRLVRKNLVRCKHSLSSDSSGKQKLSVLSNGLKVISAESPGHFVSVGLYVRTGSRYEDDTLAGASHMIDRLAFKSTADYNTESLVGKLEALGGNIASQSSRENIMYQAAVFRNDLEKIIPILASIAQRPLFKTDEVDEARVTTGYEIEEMKLRPDMLLPEMLHSTAFGGNQNEMVNTLGRPMICTTKNIDFLTPESLHRFRSIWYTANRMVLAGVGMTHNQLVELAEKHFSNLPKPSDELITYQNQLSLPARYTGGVHFMDTTHLPNSPNPDDVPLTHVYIGFESLAANDPDVYAAAILASLLGGGGSFSAGGPGKGLFGVCASVPPHPSTHKAIVPVLCDQLVSAMELVEEEELLRAKNQLKSNLLMGIESKLVQTEDLGRQSLIYDKHIDLIETCKRIDMVNGEDIKRVSRRIIIGENTPSRFEFNDGICQHWERTGNGQVSVVIQGPLSKNDPLYEVENILAEWKIGKPNSPKRKRNSLLNKITWG